MSETKQCPMTFSVVNYRGPCVKEKCAWWVDQIYWEPKDDVAPEKWDWIKVPGHCAVLDWGKK